MVKLVAKTARKAERGQTIAIVALSLIALLGMAALAIDVVSLYVAKGEAQRAADAGALAGARMFASSGFATNSTGFGTICTDGGPGAATAVNKQAEAAVQANKIAGQIAAVSNITCDVTALNPRVTVTVQQDNLQTYFSRIWNQTPISVRATSMAEAYNASGADPAVQVAGVKPWLLPNCDRAGTLPACTGHNLIDPGTHRVVTAAVGTTIDLRMIDTAAAAAFSPSAPGDFYPLNLASTARSCPSAVQPSCNPGASPYEDDIACASTTALHCGVSGISVIATANTPDENRTREGTRCLIHSTVDGPSTDQDAITITGSHPAFTITAGGHNPIFAADTLNLSRSDSIVTVPVYDGAAPCTAPGVCGAVTIAGFVQLAITRTNPVTGVPPPLPPPPPPATSPPPQIEAIVLDGVGCVTAPAANPVSAGSASPVAVRLIHP